MESLSPAAPSARAAGAHSPMLGSRLGRRGAAPRQRAQNGTKKAPEPHLDRREGSRGAHQTRCWCAQPRSHLVEWFPSPCSSSCRSRCSFVNEWVPVQEEPPCPQQRAALGACAREGGCGPPAARGAPHSSPGAPRVRGGRARV